MTGHRFDVLGVSPRGDVVVAWIDKRDLEAAAARQQAYEGAAIYYTTSRDDGRSFGPNRKLKDNVCECCRLALGFDAASTPILLWRDILPGGIRDHSLARLAGSRPSPVRATFDDWRINACPHHGPSLAIAADGAAHLAWFSGDGAAKGGVFYARSADGGSSFGKAIRLGDVDSASHPSVLTSDRRALVAWKESGGGGGPHPPRATRPRLGCLRVGDGRRLDGARVGPPAARLSRRPGVPVVVHGGRGLSADPDPDVAMHGQNASRTGVREPLPALLAEVLRASRRSRRAFDLVRFGSDLT